MDQKRTMDAVDDADDRVVKRQTPQADDDSDTSVAILKSFLTSHKCAYPCDPSSLTRLRLAGNELASLPPQIGQLTTLTELRLNDNQLTLLPPQIGLLSATI